MEHVAQSTDYMQTKSSDTKLQLSSRYRIHRQGQKRSPGSILGAEGKGSSQ